MDEEEPLNLCVKDEQRFATATNGDLSRGVESDRKVRHSGSNTTTSGSDGEGDEEDEEDDEDESSGRVAGGPEMHSALSVIEQINSLRQFIHEKRLSKFYEMYLMQLRVVVVVDYLNYNFRFVFNYYLFVWVKLIWTSSYYWHRYFPSIPSLGGGAGAGDHSSHSPTSLSKNGGGGGSNGGEHRTKESKMMASFGRSGASSGEMKGPKQQQQQQVVDNTPIGLQGLSKADVGGVADLSSSSSSGANRLNSALLYQPYDAISKELGGLGGGGCPHPGEKGNSMGGGGMLGSGGGGMMSDERPPGHTSRRSAAEKKPHIKKPLNAFMLYMKDMRANVVAECTLKESAAINQILGRRVSDDRWREKCKVNLY